MRSLSSRSGALAVCGLLLLHPGAAWAQDQACSGFNWPVDTELGLMSAADPEAVASGGAIAGVPGKAVLLILKPSRAEALPVVSGVKKQAVGGDSFSGWFKITNIEKAGIYHVSLSRDGWIDVAQNSKLVDSSGFTGKRECTVLRKSVRYELAAGETLVQLVGVPSDTIKVTVRPAN